VELAVTPDRGLAYPEPASRTPQERVAYALAYRATVDAAYAAYAKTSNRAGDDKPWDTLEVPASDTPQAQATRPDMTERYPARYKPSPDPPPRIEGPGEHPAQWLKDIYPGRDQPGIKTNCGECARAVDNTWHGTPTGAAGTRNRMLGEPTTFMAEWADTASTPASMADVGHRLRELGPGSSAVVGFDKRNDIGHWFNAVNHAGTILAVDGQSAKLEEWPPSKDGLGFDEGQMSNSDAIYFTADGKVVRNDHP
jgi:hypothetical protein